MCVLGIMINLYNTCGMHAHVHVSSLAFTLGKDVHARDFNFERLRTKHYWEGGGQSMNFSDISLFSPLR